MEEDGWKENGLPTGFDLEIVNISNLEANLN